MLVARADEPQVKIYGQRKFRAVGVSVEPMFATDQHVFTCCSSGQITVFDLKTGEPVSMVNLEDADVDGVNDAALSLGRDLFAVAVGRKVEIRQTENPATIVRKIKLPPSDVIERFSKPSAKIVFDPTGEQVFVFDEMTKSLKSFSVKGKESRLIRESVQTPWVEKMMTTRSGDIILQSEKALLKLNSSGEEVQVCNLDSLKISSVTQTPDKIFAVCDLVSKKTPAADKNFLRNLGRSLLSPADDVVVEFDIDDFKELSRWKCVSRAVATTLEGRPVFRAGSHICRGLANGQVDKLVMCTDSVDHLIASAEGKFLFGVVSGGLGRWDTATWSPGFGFEQPKQNDTTFAVNDLGEIVALTQSNVFVSENDRSLRKVHRFAKPLSPVLAYRGVSADGSTFVFIREDEGAFVQKFAKETGSIGKPMKLSVPEDAVPEAVVASRFGNTVAVRFDPQVKLGDASSADKAFAKGLAEGFAMGMAGKNSRKGGQPFDESCAIFELPALEPVTVGQIGKAAFLLRYDSLFLNSKNKTIYWVSARQIGSWNYGQPKSTATARDIRSGEINAFCAFNASGDAAFRKFNFNDPSDIAGKICWFGAKKKWLRRIAVEKSSPKVSFQAALPDDGQHIYLAKSAGVGATLTKLSIKGKKAVWSVELPAQIERVRLSPNNKFLGVKLSDSRYAVLSDTQN
jgi:hypothetical protein